MSIKTGCTGSHYLNKTKLCEMKNKLLQEEIFLIVTTLVNIKRSISQTIMNVQVDLNLILKNTCNNINIAKKKMYFSVIT